MLDPFNDPLGVRRSTAPVLRQATAVRIDAEAADRVAARIASGSLEPPAWDNPLHWRGDVEQTANYVLVLDTLNFCFWGEPRWQVTYGGATYDGYWALAAALKQALDRGLPILDPAYLETIDTGRLGSLLDGRHAIPLLAERAGVLRETGRVLCERFGGRFSACIAAARGSATRLAGLVAETFPSFNDVAIYHGEDVRLYKRAQILASDLYGAFHGAGFGALDDMDKLTAFADYKVPQVLHHLGVLIYDAALTRLLRERVEIPAGTPLEVEIRAATIWGVEAIREALGRRGRQLAPYQIDWALWQLGQDLPPDALPYHRTRTIFY